MIYRLTSFVAGASLTVFAAAVLIETYAQYGVL